MKFSKTSRIPGLALLIVISLGIKAVSDTLQDESPEVPRIDSVSMLGTQPQETDPALIWYDDFDGPEKHYTESSGELDSLTAFAQSGRSMHCLYLKGSTGEGNRKVFFGDSPYGVMARPGEKFDEIYWRIYVKHQYGWTGGGPAKMSRATSLVSANWAQAMIAHVWSSGEALTLDPASGVVGDRVVTTKYNDFDNLRWLGNKPTSEFLIHSTEESGWWVCVEARARLNTPGQADGENQLWIDGKLEAERKNLDWRGSYTGHGINAVFLEAYWNSGSPVTQSRWYDNFIISTQPIGPVVVPRNPLLYKTPYHGPGEQAAWELELAEYSGKNQVVWRSNALSGADSVQIDRNSGTFVGPLAGKTELASGTRYFARLRQQSTTGAWSDWSRWHQQFLTGGPSEEPSQGCDYTGDGEVDVADVIMLLLMQHDNPSDERADYNRDGRSTITDAVQLLLDILEGRCSGAGSGLLSAAGDFTGATGKMEGLSGSDCKYIESCMERLPLTPALEATFNMALYGQDARPGLPQGFYLSQNSPNPFNPRTAIIYSLPDKSAPSQVTIKVFDLRNQLVRTLVDDLKPAGSFTVYWDGTDEKGSPVASGVYLYRMEAPEYMQTRKMVLLR
ncbi:MAG TPA: FlgD immunoglobulin-like domain containing protein [archaeon]|nr:FlgD immunoglobulin-like domain containing protein [archaeon]